MKKIILFSLIALVITGCNIGQQSKEIKTLADCKYSIIAVNNIFISGTDVQKLIANQNINLTNIPSLALGFLSKNIPLNANLVIGISNPTDNYAAINYFDYEILVNKQIFTEGTVDQRIDIGPKETKEVNFDLNTNIYKFLVNDSIRNNIQDFIIATKTQAEQKALITIRIKPAIYVGEQLVKYPGFIDIKEELSSSLLKRDPFD